MFLQTIFTWIAHNSVFAFTIYFREMGPKNKLKKLNEQESDQLNSSDSSIESDDEYSGNEVNDKIHLNIWKHYS